MSGSSPRTAGEGKAASIVLLGDSGVGKSSLATRIVGDEFTATEATHGGRTFMLPSSDVEGTIQLVDCPGTTSDDEVIRTLTGLEIVLILVVVDAVSDGRVDDSVRRWVDLAGAVPNASAARRYLVAARSDRGSIPATTDLEAIAGRYRFDGIYSASAKVGLGTAELREAAIRTGESWLLSRRESVDKGLVAIVRRLANSLCRLIADDPDALWSIEWRDLERLVAAALEELGFDVILTPSSKDGGKDIVVTCRVENEQQTYYLEIKHWRNKRVGTADVRHFVEINVADGTDGGVFISTSGFGQPVYRQLTELTRGVVRLGRASKVVALAQHSIRVRDGVWRPDSLPDILFENTEGAGTHRAGPE